MKGAIFTSGKEIVDLCPHCYREGRVTDAFKVCAYCEEPFCEDHASEIHEDECYPCCPGAPEERGGE